MAMDVMTSNGHGGYKIVHTLLIIDNNFKSTIS